MVPTRTPYIPLLLAGLTVTEEGVYLINRVNAASVLQADVEGNFGNGLSFDETLDLTLVEYNYDRMDPRFSAPDAQGNRRIPLDVAVGTWHRWAANGSHQAKLLLNNLAIAGLIHLFSLTLFHHSGEKIIEPNVTKPL